MTVYTKLFIPSDIFLLLGQSVRFPGLRDPWIREFIDQYKHPLTETATVHNMYDCLCAVSKEVSMVTPKNKVASKLISVVANGEIKEWLKSLSPEKCKEVLNLLVNDVEWLTLALHHELVRVCIAEGAFVLPPYTEGIKYFAPEKIREQINLLCKGLDFHRWLNKLDKKDSDKVLREIWTNPVLTKCLAGKSTESKRVKNWIVDKALTVDDICKCKEVKVQQINPYKEIIILNRGIQLFLNVVGHHSAVVEYLSSLVDERGVGNQSYVNFFSFMMRTIGNDRLIEAVSAGLQDLLARLKENPAWTMQQMESYLRHNCPGYFYEEEKGG